MVLLCIVHAVGIVAEGGYVGKQMIDSAKCDPSVVTIAFEVVLTVQLHTAHTEACMIGICIWTHI